MQEHFYFILPNQWYLKKYCFLIDAFEHPFRELENYLKLNKQ